MRQPRWKPLKKKLLKKGRATVLSPLNIKICHTFLENQFTSVQSLSRVRLLATRWITACQASLSITNSWSSLKLTSVESVMPSSHLILCRPLLLLPPIPPSIRVFSHESALHLKWPKYWSFSFSIIPSKEIPGLISFRMDWLDLLVSLFNNKCLDSRPLDSTASVILLFYIYSQSAVAAAKSLQSCLTLCDPIGLSLPGSPQLYSFY